MTDVSYPLATTTWDEAEYAAIQRVLSSGSFTMGENVSAFEREFSNFTGSKYCVMVNSGSSANLLMVAALRFRKIDPIVPGDEVIVPAVSWSTTYHPLQQYGLKLKFVDIDENTLNYDLSALKKAISENTRLIMVVNLLGNPNDFLEIEKFIKNKRITLIEDNCESMGASYHGRQTGTFGVMGSFSSFFSHHICTMEGGMVVTDDEELYHIMLCLRAHGWTRNLPKNNAITGSKSDNPFEESYKFVLPGYNLRPLELSGAIGLEQLKKLPQFISNRRDNAKRFLDLMYNYPQLRTQAEIGESSWFGFSLILKKNNLFTRQNLIDVFTRNGIDVRPIVAGNFAKNETLKWFNYEISGNLPNADYLDSNGIFIGNHHYSLEGQLAILKMALDELTKAR